MTIPGNLPGVFKPWCFLSSQCGHKILWAECTDRVPVMTPDARGAQLSARAGSTGTNGDRPVRDTHAPSQRRRTFRAGFLEKPVAQQLGCPWGPQAETSASRLSVDIRAEQTLDLLPHRLVSIVMHLRLF